MLLVGRSGEVERYGILPSVPSLENQLMYVYVESMYTQYTFSGFTAFCFFCTQVIISNSVVLCRKEII